jgi:predicted transcriptional regulator
MRVHITLADDLVREIDEIAGKGKRSEYIAEAVSTAVRRARQRRAIEEGAGMLSDEDYPYWSTPEKIADWLRDLRETPSIRRDPFDRVSSGHERSDRVAERPAQEYQPRSDAE